MLVAGSYWFKEMSDWLVESHVKYYTKITANILPYWVVCIAALFEEDATFYKSVWGKKSIFDNTKTKELLKIPFRDMKGSMQEMANTLIETGYVPDQTKESYKEEPSLMYYGCGFFLMLMFGIGVKALSMGIQD